MVKELLQQSLVSLIMVDGLVNVKSNYEDYLRQVKRTLTTEKQEKLNMVYPIEFLNDREKMLQWKKIKDHS